MTQLLRTWVFSSTAALASVALAWKPFLSSNSLAAFCKDDSDNLKRIASDPVFQCMRNPNFDKNQKRQFQGLYEFWAACSCSELVDRSKSILKKYLAALYLRYPFVSYDMYQNRFFSRETGSSNLFFSTDELLLAKKHGFLNEKVFQHQMRSCGNRRELWRWLNGDLHKQLETVFPGFEYPGVVFDSVEYMDAAKWIPVDCLAKDPCPERRLENLVLHIQHNHHRNEKFYSDYLTAHPDICKAYCQSAAAYFDRHPDTTNLPFFVLWYLKTKSTE